MSPSTITLLFLLFAVIMFVLEKIPLGVTSMIVCSDWGFRRENSFCRVH